MNEPTLPEGISLFRYPRRGVVEATCTHIGCHARTVMHEDNHEALRRFFEAHTHKAAAP